MPALDNMRWEAFALEVVARTLRVGQEHKSAKASYIAAGYQARGHAAESNASRLLKHAEIQARIRELRDEAFRTKHMTVDEILAEIGHVARARMTNVLEIEVDDDGDPRVHMKSTDAMEEAERAGIAEVTQTEVTIDGVTTRTVKIKMHPKIAAAEKLLRVAGAFKDTLEVTGKLSVSEFRKLAGITDTDATNADGG